MPAKGCGAGNYFVEGMIIQVRMWRNYYQLHCGNCKKRAVI